MNSGGQYYSLFRKFFDTYAPSGFAGIKSDDPLVAELETMMEKNNQFVYFGEMLHYQLLYVSKQTDQIIGIKPEDFYPSCFFEIVHPEDAERLSMGKTKLFRMTHSVYTAGEGSSLLSTNFRLRNTEGGYSNILMQILIFYSNVPFKAAYIIKVHTNIDWCRKCKYDYHYYAGTDFSLFRYPDEELLNIGVPFSRREFEIIKLISTGLNSEQVAETLFISPETVYTHRRNILKKSNKPHLSDVIYKLMELGVL
jgi:hypothetical protein